MIRQTISAALVALLMTAAQAQNIESIGTEVLYVTDQLRLSLYAQADSQSNVIQLLSSGDKLVVEEIAGPYAKVTTPSGNSGWVKRGFLVSNPTSNLLLKEALQDNALQKEKLEKLNNSKIVIDQYEADMDKMNSKIELLEREKETAEEMVASLKQEIQIEMEKQKNKPALLTLINIGEVYWQYIGLLTLLIVLLSYLIGRKVTETRIKRKFHGIKVW